MVADFNDPLPAVDETVERTESKDATFSVLDSLEAHLNASPTASVTVFPDVNSISEEKDSE
jgi:hypothetical protein